MTASCSSRARCLDSRPSKRLMSTMRSVRMPQRYLSTRGRFSIAPRMLPAFSWISRYSGESQGASASCARTSEMASMSSARRESVIWYSRNGRMSLRLCSIARREDCTSSRIWMRCAVAILLMYSLMMASDEMLSASTVASPSRYASMMKVPPKTFLKLSEISASRSRAGTSGRILPIHSWNLLHVKSPLMTMRCRSEPTGSGAMCARWCSDSGFTGILSTCALRGDVFATMVTVISPISPSMVRSLSSMRRLES
mmetsp:Transcript_3896/g.11276  ORF Transcript_3896/g.11276 Transcript_3896/m.11276 type:complete len:255 (-) Transcript_3896:1389-2153(-)